jgi:hypothetical protein
MDLPEYMLRWYLRLDATLPSGEASHRYLRLHCILRSDNDRDLHDHPFDFTSLILKGSYREHYYDPALGSDPSDPANHRTRVYRPGDRNTCQADKAHRIEVLDGPVWTLVWSGPRVRKWGFHTPEGWVVWNQYREGT